MRSLIDLLLLKLEPDRNGLTISATQLAKWVKSNVVKNYAVVTGIETENIPGWNGVVYHIVLASYTGDYFNLVDLTWLWDRVSQNNAQAW
jgi:hypothetical protein